MFTGLIEEIGRVGGTVASGGGSLLTVEARTVLEGTAPGDSISINGACQTVTAVDARSFTVFVSPVTSAVSTLGSFQRGRRVNLERALRPASRFGGHFVQGHVDGTGGIGRVERDGAGLIVEVEAPPGIVHYIAGKGSVAVDGISLTVVSLTPGGFALYIIPETLSGTTATEWRAGDRVNVEVDIIAKYVERMVHPERGEGGPSGDRNLMKKLAEGGFI